MKIAVLSLFFLMYFMPLTSFASGATSTKDPISIPIKKRNENGGRPERPGCFSDYIHAYISENVLEIVFDEPEGMVAVSIVNDNEEVCAYTYASSMAEISMELNLAPSVYTLEIKTSFGNTYSGYFYYE